MAAATSVKNDAVQKLVNMLGADRANRVIADTMQKAGLSSLESAQDRYRFACELMTQGGLFEAIGRAIACAASSVRGNCPGPWKPFTRPSCRPIGETKTIVGSEVTSYLSATSTSPRYT